MLTLESKFAEFIALCVKNGACANTGEAIPVMEKADTGVGMPKGGTCAEGFALYRDGKEFPESWSPWVLEKVGKELDEKCRAFFIAKLKDPITCLKLVYRCPFLSEAEKSLLRTKYDGQGEEIAKAVVCVDAILKSREFNAVRAEAVATCKSITEAKTLIEASVVATSITASADTKSSSEIKSVLETERTKMTEALKQVMKEQGFVDGNGDGSVSVFDEWLHKVV